MGKAELLWQTFNLLLRVYNSWHGGECYLTEIIDLMGHIIDTVKQENLTDEAVKEQLKWELGVLQQKMLKFIDSCKKNLEHCYAVKKIKLVYFKKTCLASCLGKPLASSPESSDPESPAYGRAEGSDSPRLGGNSGNSPAPGGAAADLADFPDGVQGANKDNCKCFACGYIRHDLSLAENLVVLTDELQAALN